MRITNKSSYSIEAMYYLAQKYSVSEPVSISNISKNEHISRTFLEQIFKKLKEAKLVKSVRGPKGGYLLSRPPGKINIIQILFAVEEPIGPTVCVEENYKSICTKHANCAQKKIWEKLRIYMINFLKNTTLEDLIKIKSEEL